MSRRLTLATTGRSGRVTFESSSWIRSAGRSRRTSTESRSRRTIRSERPLRRWRPRATSSGTPATPTPTIANVVGSLDSSSATQRVDPTQVLAASTTWSESVHDQASGVVGRNLFFSASARRHRVHEHDVPVPRAGSRRQHRQLSAGAAFDSSKLVGGSSRLLELRERSRDDARREHDREPRPGASELLQFHPRQPRHRRPDAEDQQPLRLDAHDVRVSRGPRRFAGRLGFALLLRRKPRGRLPRKPDRRVVPEQPAVFPGAGSEGREFRRVQRPGRVLSDFLFELPPPAQDHLRRRR